MRVLVIVAVLLAAGRAHAYPQFQLSRDRTCASCHVKPSGGGLLTENGYNTAEAIGTWDTNSALMYGKVPTPDWLQLGGDGRSVIGYLQAPQRYLLWIPMQAEVQAAATFSSIMIYANVGLRPAEKNNENATHVFSQEHFVQWHQDPSSREGLFVRAGRLMPVFGLRQVEHTIYTRRYGGTALFSDTYGASASYVTAKYEAHLSGFVKDPLIDPVRLGNGGAAYAELRLDEQTAIGGGAMVEISEFDQKYRGEITAKRYFSGPDVLVQAELQLVNPHVSGYGVRQLVGYVMGSYFGAAGMMIDLGFGHYDENLRIKNLDRDAFDLNVHWFMDSHLEAMLVTRVELMGWGGGGPTGAYAMLQAHYRL